MSNGLALGIDLGTSGARSLVIDADGQVVAQAAVPLSDFGADGRAPSNWWQAVSASLEAVLAHADRSRIVALAVDGTSGTVLPVDAVGQPLAEPLMYNDPVPDADLLERIAPMIAPDSAAHGPTSGLAKAIWFQGIPDIAGILHQADWIAAQFSGRFDTTDENNALKTGYDPVAEAWPHWIIQTGLRAGLLPKVVPAGSPIGTIAREAAARFGLSPEILVVAGTTDGCASFLATGADQPGDAVTALGSTLTLKLLSDRPIFAPQYGIYSHKVLGQWLAGGASNTGGKVLAHYFDTDTIRSLGSQMHPDTETGLDFYPLLTPGERFPIADPALAPQLTPRPADDATFLQAMLEGIASVEALGYRRLHELGGPRLSTVRSVGGGADNPAWIAIRQRKLGVPFGPVRSSEAAAGAALLAMSGARNAGLVP